MDAGRNVFGKAGGKRGDDWQDLEEHSLAAEELSEMSDEKIFYLCRRFGEQALYWRRRFIGLLPEVHRRRLYEKKGFESIFEFAKKLAGLSEEQVRLTLNIERSFSDKPLLNNLLVAGEVSINKLARIVSIATPENQEFLAAQVKLLPTSALNVLVRDVKNEQTSPDEFSIGNGFLERKCEPESLYVHSNLQPSLELSNGVLTGQDLQLFQQFSSELKAKLHELSGKGFDVNALLFELLKKRDDDIVHEKEQIAAGLQEKQQTGPASRYIPARVKKVMEKEFGDKCAIPGCNNKVMQKHHTRRFWLYNNHDPRFMAQLCREHHKIAHSIDMKYHEVRKMAINSG